HLMLERQRLQLATNGLAQLLRVHARQRAQVELQRTLAADAVGIVATMDAAEVQRRLRHAELRVVELTLPLCAQAAQLTHHILHGFERTVTERGVGGMAAAPEDIYALHHHALV